MANSKTLCSIDGCCNPAYLRTFCNAHYLRWRRHGDPTGGAISKGEPLRWLKEVVRKNQDNCIEWPFASNGNGYGWAFYQSKRIGAHRLALVLSTGQNPPDKVAAHYCHNRNCVNPNHLSWQTQSGNLLQTTRGPGTKKMKLNQAKVNDIRSSTKKATELAAEYNVSLSLIYKVKKKVVWND